MEEKLVTLGTGTLASNYTSGSGTMSVTVVSGTWPTFASGKGILRLRVGGGPIYRISAISGSGPLTLTVLSVEFGSDTSATTGDLVQIVTTTEALIGAIQQYALPIMMLKPPVAADFPISTNNSGAISDCTPSGVLITQGASGSPSYGLYTKALAYSPPYSVIGGVLYGMPNGQFPAGGMILRLSTVGSFIAHQVVVDSSISYMGMEVRPFSNPTTQISLLSSLFFLVGNGVPVFFKITNDGTTQRFYVSLAGGRSGSWIQQASRSAAGAEDEIGFGLNPNSSGKDTSLVIIHFEEFNSVV